MRVSSAGRTAIRLREGCRLTAYKDTVGVWTIGVGHTGRASAPRVVPGMKITMDQADQFLENDLVPFEKVVNDLGVTLNQNEFDACVSLAFNIGAGAFAKSTVARELKGGDHKSAGNAFMMWVHPIELTARRKAEVAQFFSGEQPVVTVPAPKPASTPIPVLPVPAPAPVKMTWVDTLKSWFFKR